MANAERKALFSSIVGKWAAEKTGDVRALRAQLEETGLLVYVSGVDAVFDALSGGAVYVRADAEDDPDKRDEAVATYINTMIDAAMVSADAGSKPLETPQLFQVHTVVHNWEGSAEDVRYNWFYVGRDGNPPVPYAEAIANWKPSADGKPDYDVTGPAFGYTEGFIDELFTLDEAMQLLSWLAANRIGTHGINAVELPVRDLAMGLSALPVGGTDDFYMLWKADDYDLPFKVEGYFRYSHVYSTHLAVEFNSDGSAKNVSRVREWADGVTPDDVTPLRGEFSGGGDIDDIPF